MNGYEMTVFLVVLFSLTPIGITCLWFFSTRKKGYSWRETWEIEMYNAEISYAVRGLEMHGFDVDYKKLPKRIRYKQKSIK